MFIPFQMELLAPFSKRYPASGGYVNIFLFHDKKVQTCYTIFQQKIGCGTDFKWMPCSMSTKSISRLSKIGACAFRQINGV